MINRLKYILFFVFSIIYSQTSSLSFYGQGDFFDNYSASSIGQGSSKYFGQNDNGFSLSSPSTYYKNDFSLLSMSLKFSNNFFTNKQELFNNNFQLLFFSMPLSKSKSFSFGMKPLYRSNLKVYEEEYTYISANEISPLVGINLGSSIQGPMRYISNFDLSGGISEAFITLSSKLGQNSSIGLSVSKLFGTSKYKYSVDLYSLSYTSEEELIETAFSENNFVINTQKYSSSRYMLELRTKINNIDFVLDYGLSSPLKIDLKEEVHFSNTIFDETTYEDLGEMKSSGFGVQFNMNNNLSVNSEYRYISSFKPHEFLNIFSFQNPDIKFLGLGMNYKNYSKNNFYDYLDIRLGVYSNDYYYDNFKAIDTGFTIGLGINYLDKRNSFDFAFKIGTRKSDYLNFNNEDYYNFYFTIKTSENWFN